MSNTGNLRSRILIACWAVLAWLMVSPSAEGSPNTIKEFRFPIDGYELSFSIPKAFLSDYWGNPTEKSPELVVGRGGEGTAAMLFSHIHMFAGPLWVGNYASMHFSVAIVEPAAAYAGPISSLEELENYQRWQLASSSGHEHYDFSRKTRSGETWLEMTLIRRERSQNERRDDENIAHCFPLGSRRFVLITCRLSEEVPNKTSRWLADAQKMQAQVLDSVVLRKR